MVIFVIVFLVDTPLILRLLKHHFQMLHILIFFLHKLVIILVLLVIFELLFQLSLPCFQLSNQLFFFLGKCLPLKKLINILNFLLNFLRLRCGHYLMRLQHSLHFLVNLIWLLKLKLDLVKLALVFIPDKLFYLSS